MRRSDSKREYDDARTKKSTRCGSPRTAQPASPTNRPLDYTDVSAPIQQGKVNYGRRFCEKARTQTGRRAFASRRRFSKRLFPHERQPNQSIGVIRHEERNIQDVVKFQVFERKAYTELNFIGKEFLNFFHAPARNVRFRLRLDGEIVVFSLNQKINFIGVIGLAPISGRDVLTEICKRITKLLIIL